MPPKKKLLAANWKMFSAPQGLRSYASARNVDVIVFPTFLDVGHCLKAGLTVGAQYGHPEDSGAHTGDISMAMLKQLGCTHVLCGHSERRRDHQESNAFVAAQVLAALKCGLHPILCIGEIWEERKVLKSKAVVKKQLEAILTVLPTTTPASALTLAYEPIWAISGGDPNKPAATAADAQEMHAFIRSLLQKTRHAELVEARILYGGSMKPENAREILSQPDIDGGLVGNASLDPKKFAEIVAIANRM